MSSSLRILFVLVAVVVAAHLLDWWAHSALANDRLADKDLGRMLRIMGFLPFWMLAALALGLCDAAHHAVQGARRFGRALLLFFGAGFGGLVAEVLKILSRRERPNPEIGEYVFRAWADQPFHTGGLGLASSHAGVAFGATFMLARLFPSARWVWYGLGAGCAFSRVAAGAHFLSDVVVAGVLAWIVVALLWRRFGGAYERGEARTAATPAAAIRVPAYTVGSPPSVPERG